MHSPGEEHMEAVYRILRYLKSAPGRGLLFSKNEVREITGYTDSDWAGDQTDRRSTSGYFTFVEGNLVTWRSKKQKVVARSSAEAEYRGMAHGLQCDNKAAIEIAHNPVQHDRTSTSKSTDTLLKKLIGYPFVWSEDQLADILTKAVSRRTFHASNRGDERLNDRCQWVEEAEVVLPVVVTSEMVACGDGRSIGSLLPLSCFDIGLPALVGGGHGGASGVEEKLPMMRGMVVFYFLCSDLPASGDIPPYLSLSTIFAFFIAEGNQSKAEDIIIFISSQASDCREKDECGDEVEKSEIFFSVSTEAETLPRISGFSIPEGEVEHVKMRASQLKKTPL
uniref:Reverse transcriptase Ty1/copia-type domain-containing protein n=1 Tax=Salix viminalis TaxID=40686 RepID=A0A6N2KLB3_SALVM